jgi:hypothetical protein
LKRRVRSVSLMNHIAPKSSRTARPEV